MKTVFADTAYYLGLLNEDDELHRAATAATNRISGGILTTDWVLTELANAMCRVRHRELAAQFIRRLQSDRRVQIIPQSGEMFERGLGVYCARPDKDWSLTDCISFVVMKEHGVTEALTADRHFAQAGFAVLLD